MNELTTIKIDLFEVDQDTIDELYADIIELVQLYIDASQYDLSIYE